MGDAHTPAFPTSLQRMVALPRAQLIAILPHQRFDGLRQLCGVVMLLEQSLGIALELMCTEDASQPH